jgi:hypothetical protein
MVVWEQFTHSTKEKEMAKPIVLDWDALEKEGSFEPIPVAQYEVAITKVELKQSQSSEYPYFNVEMTIQSGAEQRRKVWDIWSLHPKAIPYGLAQNLPIFGAKPTGKGEFSTYQELAAKLIPQLIGKKAIVVIKHETYEGEIRERVGKYVPLGKGLKTEGSQPGKVI